MQVKEAIDIGRACGCTTIGETDELICKLFYQLQVIDENSFEAYCRDYGEWRQNYESEFSTAFEDCKI